MVAAGGRSNICILWLSVSATSICVEFVVISCGLLRTAKHAEMVAVQIKYVDHVVVAVCNQYVCVVVVIPCGDSR